MAILCKTSVLGILTAIARMGGVISNCNPDQFRLALLDLHQSRLTVLPEVERQTTAIRVLHFPCEA
ncbi:MAG: hypothetical protein ACYC9H_11590 [Sulfuricaulis sp.]